MSEANTITNNLVVAKALSRHYQLSGGLFGHETTVKALSGASFTLDAGRTLAVVGESGCGKSTLARLVTMIEQPTSGSLTIDGKVLTGDRDKVRAGMRSSVQIVFQDPYGSLNPRQKIGTILEEPILINQRQVSAGERQEKARAMLAMVGLREEHYDRYPHMFSGGQRQRIAVARALMLEPKVLVLDEPVSALDLSIQSQILNLLVELQERLSLAYIFISHDLSVVRHMADDIMVMYLGRPVESGRAADVFANPAHPYTKALLSATPIADPLAKKERIRLQGELPSPIDPPPGCPFHPRCWRAKEKCSQSLPPLESGNGTSQRFACYYPLEEGAQ